jgi:hypothetical protein
MEKEEARKLEDLIAATRRRLIEKERKRAARNLEDEDPIATTRKRSIASSIDLLEPSPAKKVAVLSAYAATKDDDSHTTLGRDDDNESFASMEKERKQAATSFSSKDWLKLSFSLPDPGSLGIVFKNLYLTKRYTVSQIETVIAGSQAETAGVVAGDVVMDESEKVVVMAESEEILKWNEGPLCFSVLRKRCTCTNQEKLAR